ncbi:MAG: radical SAM protein [Gemmatimonadales bacterium]
MQLLPSGAVVVPDLAAPLVPIVQALGGAPALWRSEPCAADRPVLRRCRIVDAGDGFSTTSVSEDTRWLLHDRLMSALPTDGPMGHPVSPSLLDLKIELAQSLLVPCRLCGRECGVDRRVTRGFCGLRDHLEIAAYAPLYNEGPLVGAPSFGVFLGGCALRCPFCYRPRQRRGKGLESDTPAALASVLDDAADAGARSWHFLGGNPDESLPSVLAALRLTRREIPVVWNTALTGSAQAFALLKGVVDVWVVDLKVGSSSCEKSIGAFAGYADWIRRRAQDLADQPHVVVRHLLTPGHITCCTAPIRSFVREVLPRHFVYVELPLYPSTGAPR